MAIHRDPVFCQLQNFGQKCRNLAGLAFWFGGIINEKRRFGQVEDLDYQPLIGDFGHDMAQQAFHRHAFAALCGQCLFHPIQRGFFRSATIFGHAGFPARLVGFGWLNLAGTGAGIRLRLFREVRITLKHPVAAAGNPRDRDGRTEIVRDSLALFFRCRVQQPHQHEEGHHGRHEIRIGNFPRPTMVAAALDHFLPLDDDWRGI
ncbi:MAG: hypothetical protein ACD_54C00127G0005 [uncultured bacterium]|nr:MAG: hypothetical protein ACD_54C00127G0005 [uncultured bacterium]